MAEEFYSFEKALRELHKTEEELKKLISEGEIRAFRDESSMKFKKEDIERFKKTSDSDLPTHEAPTGELHEELFGDDSGSASDDVGMVTQQISDSSFLEEATDAPPPTTSARAARGASPSSGASKRAPRPVVAPAPGTSSASGSRSAIRRRAAADHTEGNLVRVCLVLGSAVLLYATIVAFSAREGEPNGMSRGLSEAVGNSFMAKKK